MGKIKYLNAEISLPGAVCNWHAIPEPELIKILESTENGLDQNIASERLKKFGHNSFKQNVHIRGLLLFLKQFKSQLILILISAAGISLFLEQWLDSLIILAVVVSSAIIGYRQEFNAQKAIEKLKARIVLRSKVLRNGNQHEIPASEIVPRDIVLLSAGSMVPADGRILSSKDLYVNESALTGESFPTEKKREYSNPVYRSLK